ncbi:MAG: hypothetical protein COA99_03110 [Moraxellaceae bacterium]|nr:MAG: hypothetical protein COA99_03110 [Moraxellaceae bacterium]
MRNKITGLKSLSFFCALSCGTEIVFAHEYEAYARTAIGTARAYAGESARSDDASVSYANPAAIAKLKGVHWSGVFHVMTFNADTEDVSADYANSSSVKGDSDSNLGGLFGGPSFYYVTDLDKDWHFGISVLAPYAYGTDYDREWGGRFSGTFSELVVFAVTPSIAFSLNNELSIGLSLPLNIASVEFHRGLNQAGRCIGLESDGSLPTGTCVTEGLVLNADNSEGFEKVKAEGWGIGATVAVHYTSIDDNWQFGIVYRFGETIALEGESQYRGVNTVISNQGQWLASDVDIDLELPATFTVGGAWNLNNQVTLYSDITWKHWSDFKGWAIEYEDSGNPDQRYSVDWGNGMRSAIGVDFRLNSQWILHTGYAYDNSPVKNKHGQSPLVPAADIEWYTFGASYQLSPTQRLSFSYAFLDYKDAIIEQNSDAPYIDEEVFLSGEWSMSLHLLGVQYSAEF